MDRVLYTAMVAAKETELRQSINANNISNASNAGFKKQIVATRALNLVGMGDNTRAYAMTHTSGIDSSEGPIKFTGSSNDLTVRGDNWFVLNDGENDYISKNISFTVNQYGELVSSNGDRVQSSQGGILVANNALVEVSEIGEIFLKFPEQPQLNKIADIKVVTASSDIVEKNMKGQVVSPAAPDAFFPSVVRGALQQSNVNQVGLAIENMNLSNQFQMNMKIYDSAKKMSDSTNRLLGN
jgi:flagellar basal-body rod protein FlgF